ncbi:hypothetical protein SNE40_013777 [Patella caerulea]|uniref:Uncharacterized protein n=1 Tax=Patella caerulea TaxID=87958 RepID=A0AAN8JJZ3_PATCE
MTTPQRDENLIQIQNVDDDSDDDYGLDENEQNTNTAEYTLEDIQLSLDHAQDSDEHHLRVPSPTSSEPVSDYSIAEDDSLDEEENEEAKEGSELTESNKEFDLDNQSDDSLEVNDKVIKVEQSGEEFYMQSSYNPFHDTNRPDPEDNNDKAMSFDEDSLTVNDDKTQLSDDAGSLVVKDDGTLLTNEEMHSVIQLSDDHEDNLVLKDDHKDVKSGLPDEEVMQNLTQLSDDHEDNLLLNNDQNDISDDLDSVPKVNDDGAPYNDEEMIHGETYFLGDQEDDADDNILNVKNDQNQSYDDQNVIVFKDDHSEDGSSLVIKELTDEEDSLIIHDANTQSSDEPQSLIIKSIDDNDDDDQLSDSSMIIKEDVIYDEIELTEESEEEEEIKGEIQESIVDEHDQIQIESYDEDDTNAKEIPIDAEAKDLYTENIFYYDDNATNAKDIPETDVLVFDQRIPIKPNILESDQVQLGSEEDDREAREQLDDSGSEKRNPKLQSNESDPDENFQIEIESEDDGMDKGLGDVNIDQEIKKNDIEETAPLHETDSKEQISRQENDQALPTFTRLDEQVFLTEVDTGPYICEDDIQLTVDDEDTTHEGKTDFIFNTADQQSALNTENSQQQIETDKKNIDTNYEDDFDDEDDDYDDEDDDYDDEDEDKDYKLKTSDDDGEARTDFRKAPEKTLIDLGTEDDVEDNNDIKDEDEPYTLTASDDGEPQTEIIDLGTEHNDHYLDDKRDDDFKLKASDEEDDVEPQTEIRKEAEDTFIDLDDHYFDDKKDDNYHLKASDGEDDEEFRIAAEGILVDFNTGEQEQEDNYDNENVHPTELLIDFDANEQVQQDDSDDERTMRSGLAGLKQGFSSKEEIMEQNICDNEDKRNEYNEVSERMTTSETDQFYLISDSQKQTDLDKEIDEDFTMVYKDGSQELTIIDLEESENLLVHSQPIFNEQPLAVGFNDIQEEQEIREQFIFKNSEYKTKENTMPDIGVNDDNDVVDDGRLHKSIIDQEEFEKPWNQIKQPQISSRFYDEEEEGGDQQIGKQLIFKNSQYETESNKMFDIVCDELGNGSALDNHSDEEQELVDDRRLSDDSLAGYDDSSSGGSYTNEKLKVPHRLSNGLSEKSLGTFSNCVTTDQSVDDDDDEDDVDDDQSSVISDVLGADGRKTPFKRKSHQISPRSACTVERPISPTPPRSSSSDDENDDGDHASSIISDLIINPKFTDPDQIPSPIPTKSLPNGRSSRMEKYGGLPKNNKLLENGNLKGELVIIKGGNGTNMSHIRNKTNFNSNNTLPPNTRPVSEQFNTRKIDPVPKVVTTNSYKQIIPRSSPLRSLYYNYYTPRSTSHHRLIPQSYKYSDNSRSFPSRSASYFLNRNSPVSSISFLSLF